MSLPMLLARRLNAVSRAAAVQQTRSVSLSAPISAGYWNKDWRPTDEPPTTEEGRRAAAKKYGMIPEDYETYVSDGTGYGDYPKLPIVSAESRDPHALYDMPELKRNFGEPLHVDADLYGEDRWDYNRRLYVPLSEQLMWFFGALAIIFVGFQAGEYVRIVPCPKMPRQLGTDGKTYYTFELEDAE